MKKIKKFISVLLCVLIVAPFQMLEVTFATYLKSKWSWSGDNIYFSSGSIGVGVAVPDTALEVFKADTNQLKLSYNADSYATFGVSDAGVLTVTPSGGGTPGVSFVGTVTIPTGTAPTAAGQVLTAADTAGLLSWANAAGGKFVDGGTSAEAVYIDGNVGIGTSAPSALFQVTQNTTGIGTVTTNGTTTVTGTGTQFTNTFKAGDTITVASQPVATILSIESDTSLTTTASVDAETDVAYTLTGGSRMNVFGNGNVELGGGIKLANDTDDCDVSKAGTIRYNSTLKLMEFCNETDWGPFVLDTTPFDFSFTDQAVGPTKTIDSNAVEISGFNTVLSATCDSPCTAIAKNGVWGGNTVTGFNSGDTIAIRLTSSASSDTAVTATVAVGDTISGVWSVTTAAAGAAEATAGVSCKTLKDALADTATDKTYWIDPSSTGAFEVYCDMTTNGGGWTLVVGIDGANNNHFNVNSVTSQNLTAPEGKGKYSDSVINSIKASSDSGSSSGFRFTCGNTTSFFDPACTFDAVTTVSTGPCKRASASSPPTDWTQTNNTWTTTGVSSANMDPYVTYYYNNEFIGCSNNGFWDNDGTVWVR